MVVSAVVTVLLLLSMVVMVALYHWLMLFVHSGGDVFDGDNAVVGMW